MTKDMHLKLLKISFCLYFIATWTTIAGMEIFGWLSFLIAFSFIIRFRNELQPMLEQLRRTLPWKTCLTLFAIVVIGLLLQRDHHPDYQWDIGSLRWMFLLASGSAILTLLFPSRRGFMTFLIFVSLIAIYAVFQTFTGIDLARPGSHRAVQPLLPPVSSFTLYRSAGPWGHSLQYGYIAGQHVCFALAAVLVTIVSKRRRDFVFWMSSITVLLCSISLLTTFARGVWLSIFFAWLVMAFAASKKLFVKLAAGLTVAIVILVTAVEPLRARLLSIFDSSNRSNVDRSYLWKINWEMFKDHPVIGLGYMENETRAKEYAIKLGNPDAFLGHAHSNYLQMLSGTGILGFSAYMFLIVYMVFLTIELLKNLPKQAFWPRTLALGALGAQVVLHVGGLTEANFKTGTISHNTMMVWALVIAMTILQKLGRFDEPSTSSSY